MSTTTPDTADGAADSPTGHPAYLLPTSVRPRAYRLVLTPDLPAATFTGDVEIDITVVERSAYDAVPALAAQARDQGYPELA